MARAPFLSRGRVGASGAGARLLSLVGVSVAFESASFGGAFFNQFNAQHHAGCGIIAATGSCSRRVSATFASGA